MCTSFDDSIVEKKSENYLFGSIENELDEIIELYMTENKNPEMHVYGVNQTIDLIDTTIMEITNSQEYSNREKEMASIITKLKYFKELVEQNMKKVRGFDVID